ncbi:MAG: hypothetical protein AAF215_19895 [Cyanobacteria bacterium P01_A01_bin.123]
MAHQTLTLIEPQPSGVVTGQLMNGHPSMDYPQRLEILIKSFEHREVATHPYFEWLQSKPLDLNSLWLLFHNLRQVHSNMAQWLSTMLCRIDDEIISCVLVRQLYDELGHGKPERINRVLFDRLYYALKPWRRLQPVPASQFDTVAIKSPGTNLKQQLEGYYTDQEPFLALGALLAGKIYAYQLALAIQAQIERTQAISAYDLAWLRQYIAVETDHTGDATQLTRRLEQLSAPRDLVNLKMQAVWDAYDSFLDEMLALSCKVFQAAV